jgi:pyruvate dehydrogenase (quinone)
VLLTIGAHWREWKDPRLIVVVLNNGDLNMVTWEERVMAGDPKFDASQNLPEFPYARYAEMVGLNGISVDSPEKLGAAFDAALAADRPTVIDVRTDPDVPPLPPHITFEQAKHLMSSLVHGDPHRWRVIKESAKQVWATITAT